MWEKSHFAEMRSCMILALNYLINKPRVVVFCTVKGGIICYPGMIPQRSVVIVLLTMLYIPSKGRWLSHVVGEICI